MARDMTGGQEGRQGRLWAHTNDTAQPCYQRQCCLLLYSVLSLVSVSSWHWLSRSPYKPLASSHWAVKDTLHTSSFRNASNVSPVQIQLTSNEWLPFEDYNSTLLVEFKSTKMLTFHSHTCSVTRRWVIIWLCHVIIYVVETHLHPSYLLNKHISRIICNSETEEKIWVSFFQSEECELWSGLTRVEGTAYCQKIEESVLCAVP